MRILHRMYKYFKRGLIDRQYFNFYKNKFQQVLRLAKRQYYFTRLNAAKSNIKKTWDIINESLNRKKTQ